MRRDPVPEPVDDRLRATLLAAIAAFPGEGRMRLDMLDGELRLMLRREPPGTAAAALLRTTQTVLDEARATRH